MGINGSPSNVSRHLGSRASESASAGPPEQAQALGPQDTFPEKTPGAANDGLWLSGYSGGMCTDYRPGSRDWIEKQMARLGQRDLLPLEWKPEAWPGYQAPMFTSDRVALLATFGLIPFFSKDGKDFRRTYNARSETVATRPSYRGPWKRRQFALIPMSCFYEPNYESGRPVRWRINRQDQQEFTVAAIWDTWRATSTADPVHSFSMLTTNADGHPIMSRFHAPEDERRSVVVIPEGHREQWLAGEDPESLIGLFDPAEFTCSEAPLPKKVKPLAIDE